YQDKWLVLYFYPKDNTSGCTKEACDFTDLRKDYSQLDAEIIGISPDSIVSHQKFIQKHNLEITLLSDPEKNILKAYHAWGIKKNYGREYEGIIRSTFLIFPEQKIAAVWSKVKVRVNRKSGEVKHAQIVKEKLAELKKSSFKKVNYKPVEVIK
ncbi:MAG: peroxiredoxin, partial [Candidatus Tenebribacter burtonii]|nr:peroxiredoxin [Candidatus Tenebribacter burtonii]